MAAICTAFETLIDFELGIGESPVWDDARDALWFVDILAPAIFRIDWPSRAITKFAMPSSVGSIGLAEAGRLVVALRSGVHLFDPETGRLEFLVHPEPERTVNRLNDGKVGPDGCFWVGSMHDAIPRAPTAALYRVTPEGASTRVLDGLFVSNGLAWSGDGRTMYHADSRGPFVRAYDFDASTGGVSNGRSLATFREEDGLPDGAAVDEEGCYWSAGVTAGCLNRLSPAGVIEVIPVPAPAPTMPCFGGPDRRTLFVTSLARDLPSGCVGGTLLACEVGVRGVPVGRFGRRADDAAGPAGQGPSQSIV
jgi:sugar lactone lactonase YvrE